jgi:hypothetical protein
MSCKTCENNQDILLLNWQMFPLSVYTVVHIFPQFMCLCVARKSCRPQTNVLINITYKCVCYGRGTSVCTSQCRCRLCQTELTFTLNSRNDENNSKHEVKANVNYKHIYFTTEMGFLLFFQHSYVLLMSVMKIHMWVSHTPVN